MCFRCARLGLRCESQDGLLPRRVREAAEREAKRRAAAASSDNGDVPDSAVAIHSAKTYTKNVPGSTSQSPVVGQLRSEFPPLAADGPARNYSTGSVPRPPTLSNLPGMFDD